MTDRFRMKGQLVEAGQPVSAWVEVQDDDTVLHDFLAAGRTGPDGRFSFEFLRRSFNQQSWEREALPDLVVWVWLDSEPEEPPGFEDPPTHSVSFPQTVFDGSVADVGTVELDVSAFGSLSWLIRQANTSRRPGGDWTLDEVARLSEQVRGWVSHECRVPPPSRVELRLAPIQGAVGSYQSEFDRITLDPAFIAQLGPDGVRRLLAHEWAHATARSAIEDANDLESLARHGTLLAWVQQMVEHVPLSASDLGACLIAQAFTANHEGYAHFVEQRVVRRRLPLSGFPVQGLWQRAEIEARDHRVDEMAFRQWLAQHDGFALRHLGLGWYRHHYRSAGGRVRFHREATADLLQACMDRFGRLVRGEGGARRAPRTEPWS